VLGSEVKMEKKKKGLLFIVSAPSGTGKTTLCRAMARTSPGLHYSVSYTTRAPRPGEENGRDYHFISPEDFQRMIETGEFAEWAEIYGHRYGTSKTILERIRDEGHDVIVDIDGQGARQLRDRNLQAIFIFILPPSWEELKRRLSLRKTEARAALEERWRKAKAEMADGSWYDYIIINDQLEKAQKQLEAIMLAEHCRRDRMSGALEDLLMKKGLKTSK
jgi:guanylate kinase